jgi:hypothetical protein
MTAITRTRDQIDATGIGMIRGVADDKWTVVPGAISGAPSAAVQISRFRRGEVEGLVDAALHDEVEHVENRCAAARRVNRLA